jgi:hypothetical protein
MPLNESTVETAALAWFEALGYSIYSGLDTAPGELTAEPSTYSEVILARRFREAIARLHPDLPAEALDEALRKVTTPEIPSLIANDRTFHKMLTDGIPVGCRRPGRSIGNPACTTRPLPLPPVARLCPRAAQPRSAFFLPGRHTSRKYANHEGKRMRCPHIQVHPNAQPDAPLPAPGRVVFLFRYTLFWEKIILIIGEAAGGRYQDNRGGLGP